MNDQLPGFDTWLTTDRAGEEAAMRAEAEEQGWEEYADIQHEVDFDAHDPDHPDHQSVYVPWAEEFWRKLDSQEEVTE